MQFITIFYLDIVRTIKENRNLDFIEESDDEEEFEDDRENKFVDLNKRIAVECVYHNKFQRWVPLKVPWCVPALASTCL